MRSLLSRLLQWRVGIRWYAVALLIAPLSMTAALLALSLISPGFLPAIFTSDNKALLLLVGIAVGLVAGIFEELGWTGFAIPRLRLRYTVVATGLIVGVPWAVWHLLVNFWSSGVTSGALSLSIFLPTWLLGAFLGQLTPYRLLMVWVYDHTRSLGVAMLMHVSLAASTFILAPAISGMPSLLVGPAYAAVAWGIVAVVAIANGGKLSRGENTRVTSLQV